MDNWRSEGSSLTQIQDGVKDGDSTRNNSAMQGDISDLCNKKQYETMTSSNLWGPRLSSSRRWGPRLGSCIGFTKENDYDRDEISAKKLPKNDTGISKTDRSQSISLNGEHDVKEKIVTKSLAQTMSGHKDASDALIRKHVGVTRPHNITQITIDILSSSDSEPEIPSSAASLDRKVKTLSSNETTKPPDDDITQNASSMSISSDESSSDAPCPQRALLGSVTNQIYLTSDGEQSSVLSPSRSESSRSCTNSTCYLDGKQSNVIRHHLSSKSIGSVTVPSNHRLEEVPSSSTVIETTIATNELQSSIENSYNVQTPKTSSMQSSSTVSAIPQSRIIQPTNRIEGSSSSSAMAPLKTPFSSLSAGSKKRNTKPTSSSLSLSTVVKNRNTQPSIGTQNIIAVSNSKNIPPLDGTQILSSKFLCAAKSKNLNDMEIVSSIPLSVDSKKRNAPASDGTQSSLLSLSTLAKDRNISQTRLIQSPLSSSLSAVLKNRSVPSSDRMQSSLFSTTLINRNTPLSNERQSSLSSSSNVVIQNRITSPTNKIHSLLPSPLITVSKNRGIQPPTEVNQSSKKMQKLSSSSMGALQNRNTIPSNANMTRNFKSLNEMQNLSSSSLSTDITNKDKYPLIDFTGKCVGSTVDHYFKNRDEGTEQFQWVDSTSKESSFPKNTLNSLESNEGNHRKRVQSLMDEKEAYSNKIATRDAKNLCLSEILDEKYYQILRNCDIFTLDELRSCDATNYTTDEQIVINRAKSLTEGSKLKAWMSIRGRRMSKNSNKSRVSLNERLNHSGSTFQIGNHGTNQSRNENQQDFFDAASIEFFKSEGIMTWEHLLNFTVQDLRCKYDEWCSHYFPSQAKHSPLTVAKWQLIARSYEPGYILEPSKKRRRKFSAMSDPSILEREITNRHTNTRISDADKLTLMNDDNCKTKISYENGRPIMLLTAMNHETETLYDFRLYTGTSHIPNSGFGAFLTFEGARLLKPEAAKRSKHLMKDRYPIDVPTLRFLEAKGTDGMNVSVSLEGDNLHGNGNNPYYRVTRFPLKAILHNGDRIQVTIGPDSIHEDIDLLHKSNEIPSPTHGFGHFKTNTEYDYAESQEDFCSHSDGCGLIDIGRYGPFLHSDRKTNLEFNLKDFVFDHEPAAWNFGVSEELKGCAQIIDVTSDSTGETHKIAKAHLPMYVNEVGHNKELCQNILSREKDDRVVNYYLYIQQPMKKGQTVELLTHYGDKYEETRERKGYGKANIEHGLKDDSDDKTRSEHNIYNRNEIEVTITSMTLEEIEQTLQFLLNKIYIPLTFRIEWFTKGYFDVIGASRDKFVEIHQLSTRQWRAWRRLSWLGTMFKERVDVLIARSKQQDSVRAINAGIRKMRWNCNELLLGMLKTIKGKSGETILDEIHSEIFEENLFLVSKGNQLIHTFDESLWCATARKLVRDIGRKTIACFKLEDLPVTEYKLNRLAIELEELAADAVSNIRDACKKVGSSKALLPHFDCAVQSLYFNEVRDDHHQEKMLHAYQDALELISMEECVDIEDQEFPWNVSSKFLRIVNSKIAVGNDAVNCGVFSEILCDLHSLQSGAAQVDVNWYILWQVVRVVHCFATKCIEWNIKGKRKGMSIYSIERLCKRVGINVEDARKMLRQRMERKTKPHINKTKKLKNDKERMEYIRGYRKEDTSNRILPEGWRVEIVPRSQGNHKKHIDRYWFTKTNKKLRSRIEVDIFLRHMENPNNNEDDALRLLHEEQHRLRNERQERKRLKHQLGLSNHKL